MNYKYFPEGMDVHSAANGNIPKILSLVSGRYMRENPAVNFTLRIQSEKTFRCSKDGLFDLNFTEKLGEVPFGSYGYACAVIKRREQGFGLPLRLKVICYGDTEVFLNRERVFSFEAVHSGINDTKYFDLHCKEEDNFLFIKCRAGEFGFGCLIGSPDYKWRWVNMLTPFKERAGQSGFVYCGATEKDIFEGTFPNPYISEYDSQCRWYPLETTPVDGCDFSKMFDASQKGYLYGWSRVETTSADGLTTFTVSCADSLRLFIDGQEIQLSEKDGVRVGSSILPPVAEVLVEYRYQTDLSFSISVSGAVFKAPCPVKGLCGQWLFLGNFGKPVDFSEGKLNRLFETESGGTFWRGDSSEKYVRPFAEAPLFGIWNYPLGVTLYGLNKAAEVLGEADIAEYAAEHVRLCAKNYHYSFWDKEKFGYTGVNHQVVAMSTLDDCGSFGSTMLEILGGCDKNVRCLAQRIAEYIMNEQARTEDGALYRPGSCPTMWVDDLYMSVPFLCRWYKITGNEEYIAEAAKQFKLFKKYLFLQEYSIFSHVYDFVKNAATGVPWGRGNGWVLFSLSELLRVIPQDFFGREWLLDFFRELCDGYLKLQGENGLWRQVLNHHDAYEETSCTAMFVYAYSLGVINGWFSEDKARLYSLAAERGWQGITKTMIDKNGNVFGICRGSGYSFSPDYYKFQLLTIDNDTHGIGIVLLAGAMISAIQRETKGNAVKV